MAEAPLIKAFVLIVFALIVLSLGSAFFSLFRRKPEDSEDADKGEDTAAVKALTLRVVLSVGLVLTLVVLHLLGIIEPNG